MPSGIGGRINSDADWMREQRGDLLEEARKLLMEWQAYARTMAEAGIIAGPSKLDDRTTGFLDATAV